MNLTAFFAKLIGLWLLFAIVGMAVNRDATVTAINAFFSDSGLMYITGAFTVIIGLTVVLLHNRWTSGALPALVSFYGWAAIVKGGMFLFLPATSEMAFYRALHFEALFYVYVVIGLVLGLYLAYGGFRSDAMPQG